MSCKNNKNLFKWTNDKTHKLIREVRMNTEIYDETHKNHRERLVVDNAWKRIDMLLEMPRKFLKTLDNLLNE